VLVFASDLDKRWNDFPLSATFVPFVHESIRYLAGNRPRTEEYVVGSLQADIPATPGVVKLRQGSAARLVAVNVDPSETSGTRLSEEQFLAPIRRSAAVPSVVSGEEQRREDGQRLWQYALGLMLVVMVAESFVAARAS
jgi:hypothetical protein